MYMVIVYLWQDKDVNAQLTIYTSFTYMYDIVLYNRFWIIATFNNFVLLYCLMLYYLHKTQGTWRIYFSSNCSDCSIIECTKLQVSFHCIKKLLNWLNISRIEFVLAIITTMLLRFTNVSNFIFVRHTFCFRLDRDDFPVEIIEINEN